MSKRKPVRARAPPPCRRASGSCRDSDDAMAARRGDGGGREAAEPAADHDDAGRAGRPSPSHRFRARASAARARAPVAAAPMRSPARRAEAQICEHRSRGDPRAFVDHRQAGARMGAAADQVDARRRPRNGCAGGSSSIWSSPCARLKVAPRSDAISSRQSSGVTTLLVADALPAGRRSRTLSSRSSTRSRNGSGLLGPIDLAAMADWHEHIERGTARRRRRRGR